MASSDASADTIATMPRGGFSASWLDRHLQTDEPEYIDRDDVPDEVKQKVIGMLDRLGTRMNVHDKDARAALSAVSGVPRPRILELGAGHGKLSAKILELHPNATVTVSDRDPTSVANIAAGPLGANLRARTQVIDATAIDAPDNSYDLVVFAQAFHHLPPAIAYRAIAEATRVGTRFLVIDLERRATPALALFRAAKLPLQLLLLPFPTLRYLFHDAYISALRAYSLSALTELARAADPAIDVEFLPATTGSGPQSFVAVFSRPGPADQRSGDR